MRFTWTKIAKLFDISRSTLYRRLDEEGISHLASYTDISDADLDKKITEIKNVHPNDGECMLIGHLARCGVVVQRSHVCASIHRVDPVNTTIRRSVTVHRRVYHVDGPNCLWHIDGNHKLIKWRFVIYYGEIDGFFRTIVYLHCSNNNHAITHLSAVQSYGLPEKVCSDLGGENVDIWR